ncbi:MAG: ribonuclease Z [Bariatricus sp.]
MIAILCIDDAGGMMFNKRRQSRDKAVTEDIRKTCGDGKLWIHPFSEKLFASAGDLKAKEEAGDMQIVSSEHFLEMAQEGEYCFVENAELKPYISRIEKLIVYHWNRRYPADQYLDLQLEKWEREDREDMRGNSHEKITKEIYIRGERMNG